MLVTVGPADGLARRFTVTIPGAEILARRDARLAEIGRTVAVPGFRPGHAPRSAVHERYGAAVLAEVLEHAVAEASRRLIEDGGHRPARSPTIEIAAFAEDADLVLSIAFEALPEIPLPDLAGIALERQRAEPDAAAVEQALALIAARHGASEEVPPRPAARGEILVCDIIGRLPADRLVNGPAHGARAGRPGLAPERWGLDASPGLEREILLTGIEAGMPFFDLAVRGTARAGGFIRVFPGAVAGLPAAPGQALTLRARARILAGGLPEGALVRLGFNERSESTILRASRVPVTPGEAELEAALTLTADPALITVRPLLEIGLPAGPVDVTLRIGPARAFRGPEEPEAPPFEGGVLTDAEVEIGGRAPYPGLAAALKGLAPGEARRVEIVFPQDHPATELAGHRARFEVAAKALRIRRPRAIDDGLAQQAGHPDLQALRTATQRRLQRECDARARLLLKRALLDALADGADFPVPAGLVAEEFGQIWRRRQAEARADPAEAGLDEAALGRQYQAIAERRVRLRLLLTEIGRALEVKVPVEDLAGAIRREAARHPGQEAQVIDFYRRNAEATEALRAPLLEERIIDAILSRAQVRERVVSAAVLFGAG